MDYTLPKKYKLCSLKKIEQLFASGNLIKAFPIRILFILEEIALTDNEPDAPFFQVLFSAPKRKFKHAHDRNYIKRVMKEILRHQKPEVEALLAAHNKKLIFSITFVGTERPDYKFLEQKLGKAIQLLLLELKSNAWKTSY